ncbi:hypothetical protein [Gillisia sp. CAL575]|uniref:hypothetical protein n=1 Tax=Gillisia sp. CAL575 TaxID=985255 RepID=UPI0003A1B685|nr:hypothetical protein [Gillisia sp. CAL575]
MIKFLIITQDLRVSGTSAGVIERSFLTKLRKIYPDSLIDVLYLSNSNLDDDLKILPVNSITKKVINHNIPIHVKWINRFTTRFMNILYAENYISKKYAKHINNINHLPYNHIFIRSAGLKHETILALHNLPVLHKSIIYFHDPYPNSWYQGKSSKIHKNEILRLRRIIQITQQAKTCCASAYYMAKDLQFLYASDKNFYTLPHYFDVSAFNLNYRDKIRKKEKKIQISYHGALMLGRNIFNVLKAYKLLIQQNQDIKIHTEFILRVKGDNIDKLKREFGNISNIKILKPLDFSNSAFEQMHESDINIILENGPYYCNILPGKVPFLASTGKSVLVVSPKRSELRRIMNNNSRYIADMNNVEEIKINLENLIWDKMENRETINPFGDYFSDENFKKCLTNIIEATDE